MRRECVQKRWPVTRTVISEGLTGKRLWHGNSVGTRQTDETARYDSLSASRFLVYCLALFIPAN